MSVVAKKRKVVSDADLAAFGKSKPRKKATLKSSRVPTSELKSAMDASLKRTHYELYGKQFWGGSGDKFEIEVEEVSYIVRLTMVCGAGVDGTSGLHYSRHNFNPPKCKEHR